MGQFPMENYVQGDLMVKSSEQCNNFMNSNYVTILTKSRLNLTEKTI